MADEKTAASQTSVTDEVLVEDSVATEDEDLEAQLAYENFKRQREARKRKRAIVIAVVVVVLLIGIIVVITGMASDAGSEDAADPYAATGTVYKGDFATTVSANGATEPFKSTVVTPEVDGIIEDVQTEEGSHVNEGDVLFVLKNDSLDKAIREANTQLESAQRSAANANRGVDDAYAAYQREWKACNESGDWSGFDESGLRSAISSAEASYEDALATVENARTTLAEAEAMAEKRVVRAPVSGNVVTMNAINGAAVGSATGGTSTVSGPLVQISDLGKMKVTVQVNEVDIANITVGQKAKATFSALPGVELDATVERIASQASGTGDGGTSAGGVVTYSVDLLIPNPDPNLKPGMTATVTITTQSAPNSLIVPSTAVVDGTDDAGKPSKYVTVLVDREAGETKQVTVKVIEENNSEAAVEGDLSEGDLVVLGMGEGKGSDIDNKSQIAG